MKSVAKLFDNSILSQFGVPGWYILLIVVCCWGFSATQSPIAFAPIVAIGLTQLFATDIKRLYLALFLFIPLSMEVYLPMGLGTDLPTEQFMWILTGLGIVLFLYSWKKIPAVYIFHPISLLLLAVLGWILVTTVSSQIFFQSLKYFFARFWYIVSLFFMTLYFIRTPSDIRQVFRYFFAGLFFSVFVILVRHAMVGFSYEEVNFVLWPFYRNHVNYACLLAISVPYFYWFMMMTSSTIKRRILQGLFLVLLVALYLTYTRAAIGATVACPIFYIIIKKRLVIPGLIVGLVAVVIMSMSVIQKYKYLAYAPNYATTIQHFNFDDVLSATYQLEDLSTMERLYRWVAGYNMIKERPMLGFGPSNFYESYRPYTVESFTTYVSDNPERSGIHNYYLMLVVEQGFPGLLIFIALIFYAFFIGERLYHRLEDPFERRLILAALGSICITLIISLMNDMLETDKVGTLFLFSLALIVRGSIIASRQESEIKPHLNRLS